MLKNLEDRDVGVTKERVFERRNVGRVKSIKKLALESRVGGEPGIPFASVAFILLLGSDDLMLGRVLGKHRGVTRVRRVSPMLSRVVGKIVVGNNTKNDDDMTKSAGSARGVNRDSVGDELFLEVLDRDEVWFAGDGSQLRMREGRGGVNGGERHDDLSKTMNRDQAEGLAESEIDELEKAERV